MDHKSYLVDDAADTALLLFLVVVLSDVLAVTGVDVLLGDCISDLF